MLRGIETTSTCNWNLPRLPGRQISTILEMDGNVMRTLVPGVQEGATEATGEPKVLIYLKFPFH